MDYLSIPLVDQMPGARSSLALTLAKVTQNILDPAQGEVTHLLRNLVN